MLQSTSLAILKETNAGNPKESNQGDNHMTFGYRARENLAFTEPGNYTDSPDSQMITKICFTPRILFPLVMFQ